MSEDPFYRRSREELYPMVRESAITIHLHSDDPDPKQCMEFGAMILFDKPIIVVIPPGRKTPVPANVRRVASAILEADLDDPAFADRLQQTLKQVMENDARAKGAHAMTKTQQQWRDAGHTYQREGVCRSCGAAVEWWKMRGGKLMPMDPMPTAESAAVSHFATCPPRPSTPEATVSLDLWAVYDHPRDYPQCFVARLWRCHATLPGYTPTNEVRVAATLEELRTLLPFGLACLTRSEGDDPCIVETWI